MKTALVTGFEPYKKFKVNPATECAKKLQGIRIREIAEEAEPVYEIDFKA